VTLPKIPGWSKESFVRWVEQRLRERQAKNADLDALDSQGIPDKTSLQVWLAKEHDGQSWQQIAIRYFPQYGKAIKSAGVSKARRAYAMVAQRLEPTARQRFRYHMEDTIREVFGCTPEDFKRYLNSIRVDKRRR
jgi:hypothetical protein